MSIFQPQQRQRQLQLQQQPLPQQQPLSQQQQPLLLLQQSDQSQFLRKKLDTLLGNYEIRLELLLVRISNQEKLRILYGLFW